MNRTSWIELNKKNLEHNIAQYHIWLKGKTLIAPVVKGNAYGHGMYEIASIVEENHLIKRLCVVNTNEALTLRKKGIKKPILVLGYINSDLYDIISYNIDVSVYDIDTINRLHQAAKAQNKIINIHLKIDTGLSRLGIFPEEYPKYIQHIKNLSGLNLQGVWSHLSTGNNSDITHQQENLFKNIDSNNLETHFANSHGVLQVQNNYSIARIGNGLYGYLINGSCKQKAMLKPVLSLKTTIIFIKHLAANRYIGYQQNYKTTKPTTIAILAIGFYEGIHSKLIHNGQVIIHKTFAPIISIDMNMTTIDISHIPQAQIGDTVTILGTEGDISISAYDWQKILQIKISESLGKLDTTLPRYII